MHTNNYSISHRCVAEEQRTLALGVQSVSFRIFGSIPGPIVFGAILDSACIYWRRECGVQGNCWVYDNQQISFRLLFLAVSGLLANCVCTFLTWILYPKKQSIYRSEDMQPAFANTDRGEDGIELDTDDTLSHSDRTELLPNESEVEETTAL